MGTTGNLFCMFIILLGLIEVGSQGPVLLDGIALARSDITVEGQVISKEIERPGPMSKPRLESITVNGEKIRGFDTYFNQYVMTVSFSTNGDVETVKAPVGYHRWHEEVIGAQVPAIVSPDRLTYVDVDPRATILYALHKIGFGLLVMTVGGFAMWVSTDE